MSAARPYALSIAGFDPSGGAGILADVKTFENMGVYGLGVLSAITRQNDHEFEGLDWLIPENIIAQLHMLLPRFPVRHFKIGIIAGSETLEKVVDYIYSKVSEPVIILDPVLKASAGFTLHADLSTPLRALLPRLFCLTPNIPEAQILLNTNELNNPLEQLSEVINVYLKGGHAEGGTAVDLLYTSDHTYAFTNDRLPHGAKHGSGCVLSAALTAALAIGQELPAAAETANAYTHRFLASNNSLLGYHQPFLYDAY